MKNLDIGDDEYNTVLANSPKERPNMAPSAYFTHEQVMALGLAECKVGDKLMFHATATVASTNAHEDDAGKDKGKTRMSASLRFDMAEVQKEKRGPAESLYRG